MCEYCEEIKYMKSKPEEYIGKTYGKLKIEKVFYIKDKSGRNRRYAFCICECGNRKEISLDHLKEGRIVSCGCKKKENTIKRNTKHGLYNKNKRIFDVWNNMIARCENRNNKEYHNYGGRGIKVCNEWKNFQIFLEWAIKSGYQERDIKDRRNVLSIERVDVNGNYEPNNCKWIPFKEQGKNKRYSGRKLNKE